MPQNPCSATKRSDVTVKEEGCGLEGLRSLHVFISLLDVGYVARL
jgi:hypothetical protein